MNRDYRNGYAVDSRTQIVEQLRKSEKEYQSVLTFLEELQRQGCDQRAFLPLGPLAYASGRLKVPKGVLVLLGENYFARVSVEHALNIAKRRIAFIRKRLSDMNCENLQPEKSETRKQENESLADRWNNSMQLLEQYLQSSQVVNLCEEYDDSLSSEPIRIHGLKEDMLNKEIVEDVDWNSLLDVSGETAELVEPRHQLPDSVWDDLKQLEIAEASSLMGDLVVDSTEDMTKSGEFPVTGERNNVKESIQDAAAVGDSSKTSNSSSTNLQRNVPRKTFRGQIKERKSVSK